MTSSAMDSCRNSRRVDVQRWPAVPTAPNTMAGMASFRSEERRVGKECVSTCRSRWSPDHKKKKKHILKYHSGGAGCCDHAASVQRPMALLKVIGGQRSFFFFKQKTAYEILRSDWSSDVCSSD